MMHRPLPAADIETIRGQDGLGDVALGGGNGRGDGTVEIRTLNAERNPFKPGDVLVTSGIGGLYRPNIPVAVVARLEGDRAVAIPLANPSRIELVAVQRPYRPTAAAGPAASAGAGEAPPATP